MFTYITLGWQEHVIPVLLARFSAVLPTAVTESYVRSSRLTHLPVQSLSPWPTSPQFPWPQPLATAIYCFWAQLFYFNEVFVSDLVHFRNALQVPPWCTNGRISFRFKGRIIFHYTYTSTSHFPYYGSFIHRHFVFTVWLLWIMLQWTGEYKQSLQDNFISFGYIPRSGVTGS